MCTHKNSKKLYQDNTTTRTDMQFFIATTPYTALITDHIKNFRQVEIPVRDGRKNTFLPSSNWTQQLKSTSPKIQRFRLPAINITTCFVDHWNQPIFLRINTENVPIVNNMVTLERPPLDEWNQQSSPENI